MLIQKNRTPGVILGIALFVVSLAAIFAGCVGENIAWLSLAVFCIWGTAFLFSLSKTNPNIIYLFLIITIFIFLLSRVMVRWLTVGEIYSPFSSGTMKHIYILMYVSLLGLIIGSLGQYSFVIGDRQRFTTRQRSIDFDLLRRIVRPFLFFLGFCQLATVVERIIFYQVGLNGALRISFTSTLPGIITRLANAYILLFCIYLATFPPKKGCLLAFVQYLVIAGCKMYYGSRSDFVLCLMFMVVYFVIRDRRNEEQNEKWIGKKEITIILISIPALIILLVFIGSYRVGASYQFSSFLDTLEEFFESQGTSIDVLGYAYEKAENLPRAHFLYLIDNTYTFLVANPISSLITGAHSYPVNTLERALYGTSLDQSLYYLINPGSYLNGYGCGSSYMAETYLAFGYFGSFLFNIVLSYVLNRIDRYSYNLMWKNVLIFLFVQGLFFIPRAGFDDFIGDISGSIHIIVICVIWAIYNYSYRRICSFGRLSN